MTQAQVILVHISMATTITFVIHLVMKGKSPPSIICTSTTNTIELKNDNDNIIMKMLEMRLPTSPNKPYFTPRPSFKSTIEDRETSMMRTSIPLLHPQPLLLYILDQLLQLAHAN